MRVPRLEVYSRGLDILQFYNGSFGGLSPYVYLNPLRPGTPDRGSFQSLDMV